MEKIFKKQDVYRMRKWRVEYCEGSLCQMLGLYYGESQSGVCDEAAREYGILLDHRIKAIPLND